MIAISWPHLFSLHGGTSIWPIFKSYQNIDRKMSHTKTERKSRVIFKEDKNLIWKLSLLRAFWGLLFILSMFFFCLKTFLQLKWIFRRNTLWKVIILDRLSSIPMTGLAATFELYLSNGILNENSKHSLSSSYHNCFATVLETILIWKKSFLYTFPCVSRC